MFAKDFMYAWFVENERFHFGATYRFFNMEEFYFNRLTLIENFDYKKRGIIDVK